VCWLVLVGAIDSQSSCHSGQQDRPFKMTSLPTPILYTGHCARCHYTHHSACFTPNRYGCNFTGAVVSVRDCNNPDALHTKLCARCDIAVRRERTRQSARTAALFAAAAVEQSIADIARESADDNDNQSPPTPAPQQPTERSLILEPSHNVLTSRRPIFNRSFSLRMRRAVYNH